MFEGGSVGDPLCPVRITCHFMTSWGLCRQRTTALVAWPVTELLDQGITFSLSGEQRPFPLDLVPRVVPAEEWAVIERGVAQHVHAPSRLSWRIYTVPRK